MRNKCRTELKTSSKADILPPFFLHIVYIFLVRGSDADKGKRRMPYTANKLATIAKYFIKHHVTPSLKECRKILERFHMTRDEKQLQDHVKNFIKT